MSGDPASRNDDELLNQIDELKARMDRLMRGGSSTSNSALLTDAARYETGDPSRDLASQPADPPARARVRDLIETEDSEVVEVYPSPREVVPFPADANPEPKESVAPPAASSPTPESKPPPRPKASASDGSLIAVDDGHPEPRPQVTSFDELGNVIQQELARDASVPPIGAKKGPDLASRFGSADDRPEIEAVTMPAPDEEVDEPTVDDEVEQVEAVEDYEEHEDQLEAEYEGSAPTGRRPGGLVAAIWVVTALASGAIATLHFVGIF